MPVLKIGGKTIDEIREAMKGDGKARLFGSTGEEARAHRAAVNAAFSRKKESSSSDDKENIMPVLKIGGKTIDEIREAMKGDGKARLFGSTGEEARAHRAAVNAAFSRKKESSSSDDKPNIASRTDFSDEEMSPKFKAPKKMAKEKIETSPGDMGSVDRTADVIGPDMGRVNKEAAKPVREFTATEMAQNLMSPGYNKMKKGGAVKTKKMSSSGKVKKMSSGGSTASKRADGCAVRGKTKGKVC